MNEKHLSLRLSGDLVAALKSEAAAAGKKPGGLIREILARHAAQHIVARAAIAATAEAEAVQ
jgi:hypothetical protein